MNEIIIYVDESNTEGLKFESSEKIVGAAYYVHNEDEIGLINDMLNGNEIKGSFLMTRDMNDVLFTLLEISLKNSDFGVFNTSSDLNYFKDRSFDVFYPGSFAEEFDERVEEVRQKLISIVPGKNLKILEEKFHKSIEAFHEYRNEILNLMIGEKKLITNEDIEVIKNHFSKRLRIDVNKNSISRHSDIIVDVINSALKYIKHYRKETSVKIIIDDFSNNKIKDVIKEEVNTFGKFLGFKIEILFKDSKKFIGLQIADWYASIYRKLISDLIKIYKSLDNILKKEYFIFAKRLLKILDKKNVYFQISIYHHGLLRAIENNPINDYFFTNIEALVDIGVREYIYDNPFLELAKEVKKF